MPSPLMLADQDDYVELTLVDLATGVLGGAQFTRMSPGEQVTIRFKAARSGVFV